MSSTKLHFRDYELDLQAFELRRADHRIRLERKPMELLILLLERQGELVSRNEIIEKIWGKDFFFDAENGINNAVRKIRSALHDDAEEPVFVETSVGKGYRFIASVERVPESSRSHAPASAPRESSKTSIWKSIWVPAVVATALIGAAFALNVGGIRSRVLARSASRIHSIAVLPLENLSGDPGQDYFADGMTDALITDLAQGRDLKVVSRTSVMQFKGTRKPLPQVAYTLGVDAVVEGSVVRSGSRVRITAQLIHASSDEHLWAESFEGSADDILSIQDNVARAITERIQGKVGAQFRPDTATRKPINLGAYENYLRGLYFFDKREAEASKKSVDYFRKAIVGDPGFAPAYAGLAEALPALNWFNGKPPAEAMEEATTAAKRALELDDRSAEAHTALGALLSLYDWNWSGAEKELKHALELNPNSSLAHERYAMLMQSTGRLVEAVIEAERAQQLDPLSFFMNRELGRSLYFARRYDEALEQLRRADELKPNNEDWVALVLEQQGKQKEALLLRQDRLTDITPEERASLRKASVTGGWNGYWVRWIQLYSSTKQVFATPYFIAAAEARLGHADKTWEWMEKSADQREVWVTWIKVDPVFDRMRSHPGYKRLLRRINLTD